MLQLLETLNSTTKRKEKEQYLKDCNDPELMKIISKLTYDPHFDYYIKEFEMPTQFKETESLEWALDKLVLEFNDGKTRGNAAKERLYEIMESLSYDDAQVLSRVVKRDLKCGVSSSTINKVWPDTVYVHPYARCSSFSEKTLSKISLPCYSQTKMDGLYLDIIIDNGVVEYRSRQGSYLPFNRNDVDSMLVDNAHGFVLQGEALLSDGNGGFLSREEGNGSLNSDDFDISQLVFVCWDIIPVSDFHNHKTNTRYEDRFDQLSTLITEMNSGSVQLVDSIVCNTTDEIIDYFKLQIDNGNEGSVIKDKSYKWKNGTIAEQIKMKIVIEVDLKITGWEYGEKGTKFEHMLGKLEVQSADGSVKFNVGTGFKDAQRQEFLLHVDEWIATGKIATIKGNGLTKNKLKPDFYAIYLGRFVEVRDDKTVADTYDEIVDIINAFTTTVEYIS